MIFNSHNEKCRCPKGAVKCKTNIHFKIFLDKNLCCREASLNIQFDETHKTESLKMFWCEDCENGKEAWECDYPVPSIGLFWYHFEIKTDNESLFISKGNLGEGKIIKSPADISNWQITCYGEDFSTPDWLSGGIMYQIFPDRFFNSKNPKENVPSDRLLRDDWGEDPLSKANKDGVVTNSDYFCGDLLGIIEKLPFLKGLGVTCIYLNPIFLAHSNHRYNTADYSKIDPLLGTETDFKNLCYFAKKFGISIILDGVFSHTGSDSIYFNKENRYKTNGAYNSKKSPYKGWYKFKSWPCEYNSWWGFESLPEVNEIDESYNKYINGENGIVKKWLTAGAKGWRLDVADELPDEFIENIRASAKNKDPDAIILGEVWEDASNKISYGKRRRYLLGTELDSVMNYPVRNGIIDFIISKDSKCLYDTVLNIMENYPGPVIKNLMNILGTHDTERILTVISDYYDSNAEKILKLATAIQYTLPGVPCVYYGDEAGMVGRKDPFCRRCYPWGDENKKLVSFYQELGKFRANATSLKNGEFIPVFIGKSSFAFIRKHEKENLFCIFNLGESLSVSLPENLGSVSSAFGSAKFDASEVSLKEGEFILIKCLNRT